MTKSRSLTSILLLCAALPLAAAEPIAADKNDESWKPSLGPKSVDLSAFHLPDDLELTVWASTPLLYNPTNLDIDHAGRIWVAEGVNYRRHKGRRPGGDRIVVIQDKDGDGKAESSHTFVQEKGLIAPLGVAVFDNVVYVSQPPDLIVYTDVDRDLVFDPKVDKREVLLTGFNAINHDHSLHSVTAGPDGKLYFNNGNCGAVFKDRSGKQFYMGGTYGGGGGDFTADHRGTSGTPSDDGHIWTAGFTVRMDEDGTNAEIIGHGYRNSYEQTVTSMGDLFQNDNDDPPACRTSYILEYGCAGYFSRDTKRSYRAEKRPGQEHWRNHWRQDDPGTMDAGDVYGGGAPTGIVFYENGALGEKYNGSLLSCEPARNVIFGYQPQPKGATFALERSNFLTSNKEEDFDGADFTGGAKRTKTVDKESPVLFRPSDITVGPDGALYITDWFDPRVGGHSDLDETCSGTIYRIAPKGFKPSIPTFDLKATGGQITALRSPALNTRYLGFRALKAQGAAAYDPVAVLSKDPNKWIAARAIYLLPHLGENGVKRCEDFLKDGNPENRLTAYRALRRADHDMLKYAATMATDDSAAVRRDVALSLRDLPAAKTTAIFVELAKRCDVTDKNAVEAIGLGAANKENAVWTAIKAAMAPGDPARWSDEFAKITWRLWPSAAVNDLGSRAWNKGLTPQARSLAVESLAFIDHKSSADAMIKLCADKSPVKAEAARWLLQRGTGEWQKYDISKALKETGIYDPDKIVVTPITVPEPPKESTLPPLAEILAMKGNAERGKTTVMRCVMCHEVNGTGPNYGPSLKGWGKGQTPEVIARSIVNPAFDIAHGYKFTDVLLKDGGHVHGMALNDAKSDPLIIQSTGGITQLIPKKLIKKVNGNKRSLMLNADQLGLTAQDVADLVAFLKTYE
jgi:putative membrane-bound dehydrogenase-like protein